MIAWLKAKAGLLALAVGVIAIVAITTLAALYYRESGKNEKLSAQLREAYLVNSHKDLQITGLSRSVSGLLGIIRDGEEALADARKSADDRTAIIKGAKTQPPRGTAKVIDDATRKKVADRLNRPLP